MPDSTDEAFIIMQIGDAQLDRVCDEVMVPAIEAAGLLPRRVDRDNAGDLLKAEIISFIERSRIIVADLTNERPNCYLEVGYAMGLGKKPNLILMAREDHHHRSPNYVREGPRVHFDLEGYDILLWDPERLDDFRAELTTRIARRLALLAPAESLDPAALAPRVPVVDEEWCDRHREQALRGLEAVGRFGSMEVTAALLPKGNWRQPVLLAAIEGAQIRTFGWPIGIVRNEGSSRPHPTSDGVQAEVVVDGAAAGIRTSYDYWHLRQTGDFYLLKSLFEDERAEHVLFLDTRIARTTELLLFLSRLYSRLEVPDPTAVRVSVTYRGLRDRQLATANPARSTLHTRTSSEDTVTSAIDCTVADLQSGLNGLVRAILGPVFMLFDFFEPVDQVWDEIIDNFVAGKLG